jgi:hypothetical protein
MSPRPTQVGRLALREEGADWVAYYAQPDTMKGALRLGSIRLRLVQREERKQAFMDLMRAAFADLMEETIGTRPSFPEPPKPAPEHERAGRA